MKHSPKRTINELLAMALDRAMAELKQNELPSPSYFYSGRRGSGLASTPGFESEEAKEFFLKMLRVLAVADNVSLGVLAMHCWLKFAEKGEALTRDSIIEATDRKEYVLAVAESFEKLEIRLFPVIRFDNGQFHGLGEVMIVGGNEIQALSLKILPRTRPGRNARLVAQMLLASFR